PVQGARDAAHGRADRPFRARRAVVARRGARGARGAVRGDRRRRVPGARAAVRAVSTRLARIVLRGGTDVSEVESSVTTPRIRGRECVRGGGARPSAGAGRPRSRRLWLALLALFGCDPIIGVRGRIRAPDQRPVPGARAFLINLDREE